MKKLAILLSAHFFVGLFYSQSDNCATATVLDVSSGTACVSGTTINATSTNTMYSNCNVNPVNEVWYTYVSQGANNSFSITPTGMTNAQIVIYTQSCAGQLELCDMASGSNVLNTSWGLAAGTQVWVGVMSNEGTEGTFDFCVTTTAPDPSGGNTCAGAIPYCDPTSTLNVDMGTLSSSGTFPSCFFSAVNDDVWFYFTALQSGTIEWAATPTGTTTGVELDWAMYDITSGCPGSEVDCNYNYDNASGNSAGMSSNPPNAGQGGGEYNAPFTVTAGQTYAIIVDYYTGGSTGTMDFGFTGGTAVIAPTADFTISPNTVQCAPSVNVSITDNSIGTTTWDFGNGNTYSGSNPPNQTFMASGTYAITATSTAGVCTSTHTEFIQVFGPITLTPSSTDETCAGDCDGTASVQATGGSGSYTYNWTPNGETTPTISSLCSGSYSVTVTDAVCGSNTVQNIPVTGPVCATCLITNMTSNIGACDPASNSYSTTGVVEFTDAPATGTLTISDCNGVQQVFNAPFTSPVNYTLTGQTADGAACSVTAVFSAETTCTQSLSYTAPFCPCNIDSFSSTIGICDPNTNTFQVTGDVQFTSAPSTGTLIIEVDNGTTVYDTVINPPFVSPYNWSISSIPSDGSNLTIDVYFSADPTCTQTLTSTAPNGCQCTADAGTYSANITGDGITNYVLCFGDQININSAGDYTLPQDLSVTGVTYDPNIAYLAYSCPPSVFPPNDINTDPCLLSLVTFGNTMSDINTTGTPPNYGGTYTNNTIYYVPITFYSETDGYYAISINGGDWCWDMGTPFAVQYLPEITTTNTVTCTDVTVTITGGLPAVDGSNFSISNLVPTTASLSTTSVANNGTVTITGLQDGQSYSFDITDGNGCPITFSGGPFVGQPIANAGPDDQSCTLSYTLGAIPSVGTGVWTSNPAGATFSPSANSATATATVATPGSYTFTWSETNGSCVDSDDVIVQFSNLSYTEAVTQSTCGNADGSVTLTAANGITPYTYSIDGGTTSQATGSFTGLLANSYSVVVTDALGCQVTGTSTVTDQGGPTINSVTPVNITCNAACDGSIAINATGATQFSIDGGTTYQATNSFTGLCAGNYSVMVQNAIGCTANDQTVITEPAALTYSAAISNLLCNNVCNGAINVTSSGGTGTLQYSNNGGTSFQGSNVFSNLCAGSYNLIVTDQNGCQITNTETITQPQPLGWTINVDSATCAGLCDGSINVIPSGGTPNYTYNWGPSGTAGNVPFVPNLCTGSYSLTVTDLNGCTEDTTLTVAGPLSVTIDNITPVAVQCFADCNGQVVITATNATQYSIDGVNYVASNTFTGLCAGNYVAYAQDANGCETTQTFTIGSPDQVTLSAFGDTTICIGGTATLSSSAQGGVGGFTYAWDNGAGNTQTVNVSPAAPSVYCATATDANGCSSPTICVTVNLYQPLTVTAFTDIDICPGESASISAIASGGDGGPYTYSWDQGVGSGAAQSVSPNNTTTYTVTANDGCETPSANSSVTITVNTVPVISFTGDTLEGCVPLTTTFTSVNVPAGSNCVWSFGDGGASTDCGTTSHTFNQAGCWDINLSITTPEGCVVDYGIPNYVCTYGFPTPDFTFSPQPTTVMDPTINFVDQSYDASQYLWQFDTFGANVTSTEQNPSYTFPGSDPASYEVCLTAITQYGCAATVCDTVYIGPEFYLYVPNAFTPDKDGLNEYFYPVTQGIDPNSFEFLVFDRWGELIFESHHPTKYWDGTYKGQDCLIDVYVWKVKVKDITFGKTHEYIGHVSLLR